MEHVLVAAESIVNLYLSPSLEVEVTSQIRYGWPAEVLQQTGDWVHLRTHDQYSGWALAAGFVAGPVRSELVQVSALSANLYLEPDVKVRAPALNLPFESRVELISEEDARWLQVRLLDGRAAYVQRGDVSAIPSPVSLQEAHRQATRFLGITYTWGGTSTYGFDCSGLVQMIFRQAGIDLPRDAQAQCGWPGFVPLGREQLQPGDVLFFSEDNSEEHINHVAIYCEQPGRFLHDTTSETHPGVQFSNLNDAPWSDRLTACRRLR